MATTIFQISLFCLLLFSTLHQITTSEEVDDIFLVKVNKKEIREKISHFRFYLHDIGSGANPTCVPIVISPTTKIGGFGQINMIDNPLTVEPELSSKIVGKAQGFYAFASQEEIGLLMTMNFVFTNGKYNGSTITIIGRNAVANKVREMPVIGGSGLFRFARGYVKVRTYKFDPKTFDATVEYNVYVMHC